MLRRGRPAQVGRSGPGRALPVQAAVLASYRPERSGCDFLSKATRTCCFALSFRARPGEEPGFVFDFSSLSLPAPSCWFLHTTPATSQWGHPRLQVHVTDLLCVTRSLACLQRACGWVVGFHLKPAAFLLPGAGDAGGRFVDMTGHNTHVIRTALATQYTVECWSFTLVIAGLSGCLGPQPSVVRESYTAHR